MKIKNFLVEQINSVMDEIEKILCLEGISYIRVDNEIHCPNVILRFYDIENRLVINEIIKKNLNDKQNNDFGGVVMSSYVEQKEVTNFFHKKENKSKVLKQQNQMYSKKYKRTF